MTVKDPHSDDAPGERPDNSGDADSENLIKRLIDNQPLSDTHTVRDEHMGEHRQYGMHAVEPADETDD